MVFLPVVLVVLGAEACQLLYTGSVPYRLAVVAIVNVGAVHCGNTFWTAIFPTKPAFFCGEVRVLGSEGGGN